MFPLIIFHEFPVFNSFYPLRKRFYGSSICLRERAHVRNEGLEECPQRPSSLPASCFCQHVPGVTTLLSPHNADSAFRRACTRQASYLHHNWLRPLSATLTPPSSQVPSFCICKVVLFFIEKASYITEVSGPTKPGPALRVVHRPQ